jgi:DNA-directed RNA polymerase subunit M
MFCPKCGSLLKPKKNNRNIIACSCGYKKKSEGMSVKETIKSKEKKVEVIDKEIETLPKMKAECPKCKHDTAYYWLLQTRAGDEPETKFLKCEKCKHIWRDYN